MELLVIIVGLVLLAYILFALAFFPGWMIVAALKADTGKRFKVIWVAVMMIFFPVASYLYGLIISRRTFIRVFSLIQIGLGLFIVWGAVSFVDQGFVMADQQMVHIQYQIQNGNIQTNDDTASNVFSHVSILREEISDDQPFQKRYKAFLLMNSLRKNLVDGVMSGQEYQSWQYIFSRRDQLNQEDLKKLLGLDSGVMKTHEL